MPFSWPTCEEVVSMANKKTDEGGGSQPASNSPRGGIKSLQPFARATGVGSRSQNRNFKRGNSPNQNQWRNLYEIQTVIQQETQAVHQRHRHLFRQRVCLPLPASDHERKTCHHLPERRSRSGHLESTARILLYLLRHLCRGYGLLP